MTTAGVLLAATIALPLAMLAACIARPVRARMPALLVLAPLPALAAAFHAADAPPLFLDAGAVRLALALDRPGALLLGAAALLWAAAGAYAARYLGARPNLGRFVAGWLMALAGCLGVFVAADMITLYAMLALQTVGACGLVIHDETPAAWRSGAFYAGLALAGESALLMGMILLAAETPGGSLLIRDAAAALPVSPHRGLILALLVGGLGLKAGLVPLHIWMPLAHAAAPIPASAVLSGAVVKVGIIGLIRFLPVDPGLAAWGTGLAAVGLFTALYAVVVGVTQPHPKAVLAYSSVSQMGVVVAVIGMGLAGGDATAGTAAAFYAVHHVLVKGALFLGVGVIMATGAARLPLVLVPCAVLAVGLGGLPFTGGALAKYAVKAPLGDGLAGTLSIVSAIGTTLLMLHFTRRVAAHADTDRAAIAPAGLLLPWAIVAAAALAVPWGLYLSAPPGALPHALAFDTLWGALWPVATGALLALGLARAADRVPALPQGDIAVVVDAALSRAPAWGDAFVRADGVLRGWTAAGVSLLVAALVLGAGFAAGR